MKTLLCVLGACCGIVTAGMAGAATAPAHDGVQQIVAALSLEQKVGQLFMVGNLAEGLTAEELFSLYHFGNIFFGYDDINRLNGTQIARRAERLQALAQKHNTVPALIATDQEGGLVNRVKDAVLFPSEEYVGAHLSTAQAEALAMYTAQQLAACGINTNFSPVIDVATNPHSHIVKKRRAFSADPAAVARYGATYLRGYRKGGIIGCAKHFPGYGDVAPDPHRDLPTTTKTREELQRCELVPYTALIASGDVDLIMTAHIVTPGLASGARLPATVSQEVIQRLLRDTMRYDGVVITDDLNMGALASGDAVEDHAIRCINAGVDILLFVGRRQAQIRAWKAIRAAVQDGRIPPERLDASVTRILALKRRYGLLRYPVRVPEISPAHRRSYAAFLHEITGQGNY
jgi:beta-N-acetylhexosaminidase